MSVQIAEYRINFILPTNHSLTRQCVIDIEQMKVNPSDLSRAGQHILDWIACSSLGRISQAGTIYNSLIDFSTHNNASKTIDSENQKCTAIGGRKCQWQDALSHNGALGNVLEMDDIHRSSILHPGPVVIPAALAIAEHIDANLQDFLTAVIKGYEVTIWLGQIIGQSHYKYFHNTATCGSLGAAMAVCSLLKLDQQQTVWALGNAGSKTGGLWQMRNEKVLTKQWHNSESARSGAMAAILASQGLSGPEFILEGPQGVFSAMSSDAIYERPSAMNIQITDSAHSSENAVSANSGDSLEHTNIANNINQGSGAGSINHHNWRMYDCSFKPWPACRHAHPAIDAVLTIFEQHQLTPGADLLAQIKSIHVDVYKDAMIFCDKPNPETELEAKFSIQHALSAIVMWGNPELAHYSPGAFNNSDIAMLRKKVSISTNQAIQDKYPQHFGVKCTLQLHNSRLLSVALQDTLGDPERPLSNAQLNQKATMLLQTSGMGQRNIQSLCHFNWSQNTSIHTLTQLFNFEANTNDV